MKKKIIGIVLAGVSMIMVGCGGGGGGSDSTSAEDYTYTLAEMKKDVRNFNSPCIKPEIYLLPLDGHWEPNGTLSGTGGKMFISGQTDRGITLHMLGIEDAKVTGSDDELKVILNSSNILFSEETRDILFDHIENCISNTDGVNTQYRTNIFI